MHMFMSFKLMETTKTSIDKMNKIHKKVLGSKFVFKISTIHINICAQTITVCSPDFVPDW